MPTVRAVAGVDVVMLRRCRLVVLMALCALAAVAPAAAEARPRIVAFEQLPADAVDRLRAAGVTRAALFPAADAAAISGPAAAYRRVARWRDVVALYPERRFDLSVFQSKPMLGVDRVHAGAPPLPQPYTGRGVTVAVFDTGIEDLHPDLDDRVAANLYFEASGVLDSITDGEYSRSRAETPVGFDELQHGTLVAGIVAGTGEAATGADMRGMAPEATLVNFKLIGQATHEVPTELISETSALAAYQWMLDHRDDPRFPGGIRVATNSWGWDEPGFEPVAFTRILQASVDAGVALVFAAGNSGPGAETVGFPARLPWVISVGANCKAQGVWTERCPDGAGQVADFSSRGPQVDVLAPGVDVWGPFGKLGYELTVFGAVGSAGSTPPPPPGSGDRAAELANRAQYQYAPGTSFAAPHVGGIVALMLQANPSLTQAEIERILQQTATDLGPPGFDPDNGFGQVDALRAVGAAAAGPPPEPPEPPAPVTPAPAGSRGGCALTGSRRVSVRAPRVTVRCAAAATVRARLTLPRRAARRSELPATLAAGRARAAAGETARLRMAFTRRARRGLRRLRAARLRALRPALTVVATDGTGARVRLHARVRLVR